MCVNLYDAVNARVYLFCERGWIISNHGSHVNIELSYKIEEYQLCEIVQWNGIYESRVSILLVPLISLLKD